MTVVRGIFEAGHDGEVCFLCDPDPNLVYEACEHFLALLGHGPIGEGYSLIATREHLASMLDLPAPLRGELQEFTRVVRARLGRFYGACVVTEHGRVPPCLDRLVRTYEPHCLHAHRLVFPGAPPIDLHRLLPVGEVHEFESADQALREYMSSGQYLYAENADGTTQIARVSGPFPRQFFRRVVAGSFGRPELSDWRQYPNFESIARAKLLLRAAA